MADEQENATRIELDSALGADAGVSIDRFTIYIPNKDRDGKEFGSQRKWVLEAIGLLTEINGGATAMPPVEGAWADERGAVVWEAPVVVYSFIRPEPFLANLARVRAFLHGLGRETRQGEVAFEFQGRFYRISMFDPERSTDGKTD